MIATFIDVEEPVLNVYADELPNANVVVPGQVWDFGCPEDNSMRGSWRILSVERFYEGPSVLADRLRVNVIRAERYAA